MTRRTVLCTVGSLCVLAGVSLAADWPQWMGPNRDNLAPDSPALVDAFADGGPAVLWTSEEVFGGGKAGWGTVAVADAKAYVLSSYNFKIPFPERKLDANGLWQVVAEKVFDPDKVY